MADYGIAAISQFQKSMGAKMKRTESLNNKSDAIKARNFAVWCEHCSIRIAPNEERIAVKDETYHERCYAKSKAIGKLKNELGI